MPAFNVFVEGPVDSMGLSELADSMAQRYGLPAADLVTRLQRGRFRVKSNLDAATAERYRKDLEKIGARVVVEDAALSPTATPVAGVPIAASTVPVQSRAPALSLPPIVAQQAAEARPTQDPRTFTILGPQHTREPGRPGSVSTSPTPAGGGAMTPPTPPLGSRPATSTSTPVSGLAAAGNLTSPPRPSAPQLASGLSAAFAPAPAQQDLGALSAASFSLASLDGQDDVAPPPPPEPPPAVVNIAARPKPDAPRPKPSASKPMDLFAPPDAGDQDLKVELAVEEVAERAAKRASIPPETAPAPVSVALLPSQRMGTQPVGTGGTVAAEKPFSREQFAIGVVIALVVGFVPAHLIASAREKAAFAAIDKQVVAVQEGADSAETYQVLDTAREKFIEQKLDARSSIGMQSMLIWAVVSAGVGFAFFRLRKS